MLGPVLVPIRRPVQAAQLVVDDPGIGEVEGVGAWSHRVLQGQRGPGVLVVVGDPGDGGLAIVSDQGHGLDVDLRGVEDDLIEGLGYVDPNRYVTVERECAQIRLEEQVVMGGDHTPGQPERVIGQLGASPWDGGPTDGNGLTLFNVSRPLP